MSVQSGSGNFFAHEDCSPVTKFQFPSVFRRCLAAAGFCPSDYGTHSFRIGDVTEAYRAGLSNADVQRTCSGVLCVLKVLFGRSCWINCFFF